MPATALLLFWTRHKLCELNEQDAVAGGFASTRPAVSVFEYRSEASLFGLPLVHIRFGGTWANMQDVVKAWIAIGDSAIGVIFAFGGMAIAPVCIGGFAVGGVVFGGFALGVLCYAGFGFGVWVVGGLVSGMMAVGGCAFAWKSALGGLVVAREFALGGVALAPHANDAAASAFIKNNIFFQYAYLLVTKWLWPTMLIATLPSLLIWRATRKKSNPQP